MTKKKTIILSSALLVFLILLSSVAFGQTHGRTITAWFSGMKVTINNTQIAMMREPFIYNDEIYVPIGDIADALYIYYDHDEKNNQLNLKVNRGQDTADLSFFSRSLYQKEMEIQGLKDEIEALKTENEFVRRKNKYSGSYGDIYSAIRMEEYLRDYYEKIEKIKVDINFSKYESNRYRLHITVDTDDFDDFKKIETRKLERWVNDMVNEVQELYDEDAEVEGYIRSRKSTGSYQTYVDFEMKGSRLHFDYK